MSTSRHRAREIALQILYRYDLDIQPSSEFPADLTHHFDHFAVDPSLREFSAELVVGTLREIPKLDEILERHASNWKVARMASVDRSLLRLATYELLHCPETAPSIVIDEAVELAKQFGTAETPLFINGILDSIKKEFASTV